MKELGENQLSLVITGTSQAIESCLPFLPYMEMIRLLGICVEIAYVNLTLH